MLFICNQVASLSEQKPLRVIAHDAELLHRPAAGCFEPFVDIDFCCRSGTICKLFATQRLSPQAIVNIIRKAFNA